MSVVNVGQPAPKFQLDCIDSKGRRFTVSPDQIQGRWTALLFYPRDFSFVCPTELIAISARIEEFAKRNCQIYGISIDDLETHLEWFRAPREQGGIGQLRIPLATDPDGTIAKNFGAWDSKLELAQRGLFIIDPKGEVQYSLVHGVNVGRNVDEILRVLDALNAGGLCPVNWTSADGTLDVRNMLMPGRTLGHYRLKRELGSGTFGSVFQALDLKLKRPVALKILKDNQGTAKDRLLQEARAAAGIRHDNVCTIFAVDEIDGLPVIAMEFLDGKPLTDVAQSDRIDNLRIDLMIRLAKGLDAAHRANVIHGDLKPGNVIVVDNNPVIVDFGLAFSNLIDHESFTLQNGSATVKSSSQNDSEDFHSIATHIMDISNSSSKEVGDTGVSMDQTVDSSVPGNPMSGKLLGTPAYMAPETFLRNQKDEKTDIFALGIVFAELLSGTTDFLGQSFAEIFSQLKECNLSEKVQKLVPKPFTQIVNSMLAADPQLRPNTTQVMQQLEQVSNQNLRDLQ